MSPPCCPTTKVAVGEMIGEGLRVAEPASLHRDAIEAGRPSASRPGPCRQQWASSVRHCPPAIAAAQPAGSSHQTRCDPEGPRKPSFLSMREPPSAALNIAGSPLEQDRAVYSARERLRPSRGGDAFSRCWSREAAHANEAGHRLWPSNHFFAGK